MSGGVFICYRREETAFAARAIHDRVVQRLERENVFLDVDNIDLGVDWFNVLTDRVGACDALVAVIGRNWVSSADKDGLRRLDDPEDFVRIEIEAALQRNVRVIPVLVDGAAMPKAGELPESLKGLARRQGTEVSPARFEADVEKLTRALVAILEARRSRDVAEAEAVRRADEERRAREAAEAERAAREERERQEAAETARAEEARRHAETEAGRRPDAANAVLAARKEREKQEAAEAARAEQARRVEGERRAQKAAEAERAARKEREQREAAEAAEKVAETRRPVEAEAARQPKDANDGSRLFSGTGATGALSAPRSPPVRTYSTIIAATIAIGIAAALAILVAMFGPQARKFSAPAGDKVAEQAAADKAAADKVAADKAAADKTAADKAAADTAAADNAAADKAAATGCFAPWSDNTKLVRFPAKKAPYRIALANGYIANTWRIQMIQTAKAYAAQPEVAAKLKEFKVVSTGEDVAAQIAAINNFIDSGFDAIVVNAQNPTAFKPVIKRAKDAGVVLVAFDNTLDTEDAINVDVDQKGLGVYWAQWLDRHLPNGGKILEVRGVSGTSVDRDRHDGIHETLDKTGKKWDVVEVFGKWDDPTAQKVAADAIAVQRHFDGFISQEGGGGVVQALTDAKHPFVPFSGETANGFRKLCAKYGDEGLKCASGGTGPAQVAVAIKVAIAALEGYAVPQSIKLPLATTEYPNFKDGVNYYANLADHFFAGNSFPICNINISAAEIMAQTKESK